MTLAVEKTFAVQGVQIPDSSLAREITQLVLGVFLRRDVARDRGQANVMAVGAAHREALEVHRERRPPLRLGQAQLATGPPRLQAGDQAPGQGQEYRQNPDPPPAPKTPEKE